MTHYRSAYVTLNSVIQQLNLSSDPTYTTTTTATSVINAQDANTRNMLKDFIFEVSEELYNGWSRDFLPYVDTLTVYANTSAWSKAWYAEGGDYVFDMLHIPNRDLLAIDSITLDGNVISSAFYRLDLSGGYPANRIIFDADNVSYPTSRLFSTSIAITGTWGYHESITTMWADSGDTVQNASQISASATALEVTDGNNFEVYQYLKIEDEYLFITDITTNTLTVERAKNGTTGAIHANGLAISTYQQTPSVDKEVRRMVIRSWHLRNGIELVTSGDAIKELTQGKFNLSIPKRWGFGSV